MEFDGSAAAGAGGRVIYPELPSPLTASDLRRLFSLNNAECQWAGTIARTQAMRALLLVQLKIFQAIGRFLPDDEVPTAALEHVRDRVGLPAHRAGLSYLKATRYRHQSAVIRHLGVTGWGEAAHELAQSTMMKVSQARTDPGDLINAALDALIRHRFELPAHTTLRRLAGSVHSAVNAAQWEGVCEALSDQESAQLEEMLKVESDAQESPFAVLCRPPGRVSRKNLNALIERLEWLERLPDADRALQSIAETKVIEWANEARRLKAPELREYVKPRRLTLLLATVRHARAQVLDDLTTMLLKLARRIERRSHEALEAWRTERADRTDDLIRAFRDSLTIHGTDENPELKLARLEALFAALGGREHLEEACTEHLRHERRNWRPFAWSIFVPMHSALLRLIEILPLKPTSASQDLMSLISAVSGELYGGVYFDYYELPQVSPEAIPREWRKLVLDDPRDPSVFNRRQLEVVTVLELAAAIEAGEIFVSGSLSYDEFWQNLPPESADPDVIGSYTAERGWGADAEGFMTVLKDSLERQAYSLDRAIHQFGLVKMGRDGRPIVMRSEATAVPHSAVQLEKALAERLPERAVLSALNNTEHWTKWSRHFGLPSRLNPQIKDAAHRYVLTAFAYGCGLGPTQAARHLKGNVSADQLAFVDRRHIDVADLRAASADLVNLYAQFELPRQWGTGESAAADGTHFETYEDNLMADHHIRYGKTGGIAYRHIADNYIAFFSRFIACGTYEATYILDALFEHGSDLDPRCIHADTHGQSAAVFGLVYLLGIELMPRIRRWRHLRLYAPNDRTRYRSINALFAGTVNWSLIREQYDPFMQLAVAIQSGQLAPSAVLARVSSSSARNRFALALQELGKAVRTRFLLQWIEDDTLRRVVHKCTTKIERHHRFAKYLAFGGEGLLRTNDPLDHEKAIVYNELIANAVALQNVVDQTQVLHALKSDGVSIDPNDVMHLSPYGTKHLKRFGDYPTALIAEPLPALRALPS